MTREVKLRLKTGRDGTHVQIALYDDRGRFVLTARADRLDLFTCEQIDDYIRTGRLGGLAMRAVRRAKDADHEPVRFLTL